MSATTDRVYYCQNQSRILLEPVVNIQPPTPGTLHYRFIGGKKSLNKMYSPSGHSHVANYPNIREINGEAAEKSRVPSVIIEPQSIPTTQHSIGISHRSSSHKAIDSQGIISHLSKQHLTSSSLVQLSSNADTDDQSVGRAIRQKQPTKVAQSSANQTQGIGKPRRQRRHKDIMYNHGRWTKEEHDLFLKAYQECGRDWSKISREYVTTRMRSQVASHAQKYLTRSDGDDQFMIHHSSSESDTSSDDIYC